MPPTKYLNVVFQGGGVRGIAYAGVLETKPEHVKIYAAAGTSAGSIVAGLLAIGKTPPQIKSILERRELRELVDPADSARMLRLVKAWRDLKRVWDADANKISLWPAAKFAWSQFGLFQKDVFPDLREVWNVKGLHSSSKLRTFLDKIFENKTFSDLEIEDLKIVAADVDRQKYRTYSKAQDLTTPIAEAVHASVSIPIFFQPFTLAGGGGYLVDGGLLSNFPSFLFAQGHFPTMGFRLVDVEAPAKIDSTGAYLRALLLTMTEAHDKERGDPPHFRSYKITTPAHIPSTKFSLTDKDVQDLYNVGREVGESVEWDKHSAQSPVVPYYDKKPHETLQFSLEQAHSLFTEHYRSFVETVEQRTTFVCRIELDWSTTYSNTNTMKVKGNKQLVLARFVGYGAPASKTGSLSLIDFPMTAEEIVVGGVKPLIRVPAYNTENEKGFLLFFVPAISADGERTFQTRFSVYQEFAKTLEKGQGDVVSYTALQRADDHRLHLTFEILVDTQLPSLKFDPQFNQPFSFVGLVEDPESKRIFRRFQAVVSDARIGSQAKWEVKIRR